MVRNEEKYEQAVSLRKRGFTLEEIAKYCDISKSTASKWLQNNTFSAQVTKQNKRRAGQENAKRLRLVNKARGGERSVLYREAERSAETEYKHYKKDPLFVAGLMLYHSEGDLKNEHTIRLTGSKIDSHRIFLRFATEYLGVDSSSVRIWLLLYPIHKEEQCVRKWKQITGLSLSQFGKNQYLKNNPKKQTLHFGVGNTVIGNKVLKTKIGHWIKLLAKDLSK
jgi:transcriptional regulator with XRE-family HTH domain